MVPYPPPFITLALRLLTLSAVPVALRNRHRTATSCFLRLACCQPSRRPASLPRLPPPLSRLLRLPAPIYISTTELANSPTRQLALHLQRKLAFLSAAAASACRIHVLFSDPLPQPSACFVTRQALSDSVSGWVRPPTNYSQSHHHQPLSSLQPGPSLGRRNGDRESVRDTPIHRSLDP